MALINCPLSSFAVCAPDPNRGIRMQAKIEKMKKDASYHSASLKYWNRETEYTRGKQRIARGLSRAKSDQYVRALHTLGTGRRQMAQLKSAAGQLKKSKVLGGKRGVSRSTRYGRNEYRKILAKQAQIESSIDTTFGRNWDGNTAKINRFNRMQLSKNLQALGTKPEYGMPVMMPPKDKQGQMMANLQLMLGIAAAIPKSDIRAKENIEHVGVSPSGHKIYEWNYIENKNTRYRGVIAQDVVKIDPMAVSIRSDGFLGVNYNKIDVNMEVIS